MERKESGRYERLWSAYHKREYELEKVEFTRTSVQNITAIGTHDDLIRTCVKYQKLHQSGTAQDNLNKPLAVPAQ